MAPKGTLSPLTFETLFILFYSNDLHKSKKISNDQELMQSEPKSRFQNQSVNYFFQNALDQILRNNLRKRGKYYFGLLNSTEILDKLEGKYIQAYSISTYDISTSYSMLPDDFIKSN